MLIVSYEVALGKLLDSHQWFKVEDIADVVSEKNLRTAHRFVSEVMGSLASSLEAVRDFAGEPLSPSLLPHLAKWMKVKRHRARILQLLMGGKVLASVDFRGQARFRGLKISNRAEISNAISELDGPLMLIPHGHVQEVLYGICEIGSCEILDVAHVNQPFAPRISTSSGLQEDHKHLRELELESIKIFRAAISAAKNPAMLFSMGKDSMAMLSLAERAFAPEPIPFPLLVIDTRWKFSEMYKFRNWIESRPGLKVIVHINPDAIKENVNPFDFGSAYHTEVTKTQALKQILTEHKFDYVFGGARRDEEKSRAKERVFSVRNEKHEWDPKAQRPEFWDLYNTHLVNGQTMRVFPISNWTEIDVWRYLEKEGVPLVPLYFSKRRAFIEKDGSLIMIDDSRYPLSESDIVQFESIRFRTLGCYPLTGATRSDATTIPQIIEEIEAAGQSERSTRVIDFDKGSSMEQKKKDGYF